MSGPRSARRPPQHSEEADEMERALWVRRRVGREREGVVIPVTGRPAEREDTDEMNASSNLACQIPTER